MKKILILTAAWMFVLGISGLMAQSTTVQTWDFEASIGDWVAGEAASSIELSTEQALSGTQSVKMVNSTTGQINIQNDVYEDVLAGDTLQFNVWISAADLANVNGIQIFWQTGSGWSWNNKWIAGSSLTGDAWNTISAKIPTYTLPLDRIGFQVLKKTGSEAQTVTVYFDDIKVIRPPWTIVVDAYKDDFYNTLKGPDDGYLQIRSYSNSDNGRPRDDADCSAKVWAAWDSTWFYVYVEVVDDTVSGKGAAASYAGDNLELKVDPQATDSTQGGTSIFDMRLSAPFPPPDTNYLAVDTSIRSSIAPEDKMWARRLTSTGYALELAVKWTAIKLSSVDSIHVGVDSVFGFALNVHDCDNHGRKASITWAAVLLDAVWNTPKDLGTVKFLADHKLQFIPKNNMTGLTNIVPYDGSDYFKPIVIDGKKDIFYTTMTNPRNGYIQIRSNAYDQDGAPANDADLSAKVWTAWDTTWFYLYAEVKDDTLRATSTNVWEEDEMELKFDPQPKDSVVNSIWDTRLTALGMATAGVVKADSLNNVADSDKKWARGKISGGYSLEMAIKWSAIGHTSPETLESVSVAVDSIFGMAICLHDNDGHGKQASILWAAVLDDAVDNTPKYLGQVKFLSGNRLQFTPTNAITPWRTNSIKYDGTDIPMAVERMDMTIPTEFKVSQNYPNPFNPVTTISYSLPTSSQVRLAVYDMLGREVAVVVNEQQRPGVYQVNFDGKNLASGVYFYRLVAGRYSSVQKMLLLK